MTTGGGRRAALLLCALSSLGAPGCALTSKSEPSAPRYFSPERPGGPARSGPRPTGPTGELRLGRVSGPAFLDERLVYRDSAHELGYYQERRWTEAPDQYLSRRLAHVLFEERGLHRVVAGAAATLEVELVAFEEIRAPRRAARVEVIARLRDQRTVRWEETLTVEEPIAVTKGADLAEGMVEASGGRTRRRSRGDRAGRPALRASGRGEDEWL
jgi:cholesterol transport system auxiliary component